MTKAQTYATLIRRARSIRLRAARVHFRMCLAVAPLNATLFTVCRTKSDFSQPMIDFGSHAI
jgi:hypothetical protein